MGLRTWLGLKNPPPPSGQSKQKRLARNLDESQVQPGFPIDLVYTWVDGADPEFLRQRQLYSGKKDIPLASASPERWRDHHELRYSLRSVAAFSPWIRHVFLVTNGQRPNWLANHRKISVITHDQILDRKYLPTFNSHVIESALHRIPGLSEHYIYLNDDIMFLRPMEPGDFFTGNGLVYGFLSGSSLPNSPPSPTDLPSVRAAKNAVSLIHRDFGVWLTRRFKHAAYPQRKSVCEDAERRYEREIEICRRNRFRQFDDIVFCTYLSLNFAYMSARGLLRRNRTMYVKIRERGAIHSYRHMLRDKELNRALDTVCLNDAEDFGEVLPNYQEYLLDFLNSYFPEASAFEQKENSVAERSAA